MKPNIDETQLMAYLYGELSQSDAKQIEQYLAANSDKAKELEQMRETRRIMGALQNQTPQSPPASLKVIQQPFSPVPHKYLLRNIIGAAASIALLLWIGYALNFRADIGNGHFSIAFGEPDPTSYMTIQQVDSLVAKRINRKEKELQDKFDRYQNWVNVRLKNHDLQQKEEVKVFVNLEKQAMQETMRSYLAQLTQDQMHELRRIVVQNQAQQTAYVDHVVADFSDYLEANLSKSFDQVNSRINSIQQNADLKAYETNLILAGLKNTLETHEQTQTYE